MGELGGTSDVRTQDQANVLPIRHIRLCYVRAAVALYVFGSLGITAGAHRLWSHRSYRAKLPFKVFLAVCQTLAFQVNMRQHEHRHVYMACLIVDDFSRAL